GKHARDRAGRGGPRSGAGPRARRLVPGRRSDPAGPVRVSRRPARERPRRERRHLKGGGMKVGRRGAVPPFIVMDVMQAAADREASGRDVLHMEVGQPSTGAPRGAVEAAKRALEEQVLGYTLALGIDPLRRRIARHYRERHGVDVPPGRVAVTVGSSGAFLLTFLAAFDPGDRV